MPRSGPNRRPDGCIPEELLLSTFRLTRESSRLKPPDRADEEPPSTRHPSAPRPVDRSGQKLAAVICLILALAVVAYLVTRPSSHTYAFVFRDAGQIVKGDLVRIGGVEAGSVKSVGLSSDYEAQITVSINNSYAPLREGTTAVIREQGLIGVANRYLDVSPAPSFQPALPDGAVIGTDDTTSIVEIDQLFDALGPKTRHGLQEIFHGGADQYRNKELQANLSAEYFSPALAQTAHLFAEINADSSTLQQFLVQTGSVLHAFSANRQTLTDLITNTRETSAALSANTQALSDVLVQLPPALRQGSQTFADLRPAVNDIQDLLVASGPADRNFAPFLNRLTPVLQNAVPDFRQFRRLLDLPGPNNDLYDALLDLPPLAQLVRTTFPHSEQALDESVPIFSFVRPYIPDTAAFVRNFDGAAAPYDANGHYIRSVPIFDAFNFTDNSSGGQLTPKPVANRGQSPALSTGFMNRCPGSAGPLPADGSAPFVDNGPLANPQCNPAEVPGAPTP